jgi:hypothetical protein
MNEFRRGEVPEDQSEIPEEEEDLSWLEDDEPTLDEEDEGNNTPYDPQDDDFLHFQMDQQVGFGLDQNISKMLNDMVVDQSIAKIKREIRGQLDMDPNGADGAEYTFFPDEESRRQLFEYCKGITEYLHEQQVADLVIVDRSARPVYVGVRECWHKMYPDEELPGIFFVNPKGFTPAQKIDFMNVLKDIMKAMSKGDSAAPPADMNRDEYDIQDEFANTYRRLMTDRDKPILLFDTCIHSGGSLKPVKDTLEELGFDDLRIGAVQPADPGSAVRNEFYVSEEVPKRSCQPFGVDRIVQKTYDHVYSTPTQNDPVTRKISVLLRQDIKRAVDEYLDQEQLDQPQ